VRAGAVEVVPQRQLRRVRHGEQVAPRGEGVGAEGAPEVGERVAGVVGGALQAVGEAWGRSRTLRSICFGEVLVGALSVVAMTYFIYQYDMIVGLVFDGR
jgi:hypothetical protein